MHQDGPSVSAKTPGRAVAYPLDVITLASHTTADKRRTSPLPGHHHDHTAASRSSSRKLAINRGEGVLVGDPLQQLGFAGQQRGAVGRIPAQRR